MNSSQIPVNPCKKGVEVAPFEDLLLPVLHATVYVKKCLQKPGQPGEVSNVQAAFHRTSSYICSFSSFLYCFSHLGGLQILLNLLSSVSIFRTLMDWDSSGP